MPPSRFRHAVHSFPRLRRLAGAILHSGMRVFTDSFPLMGAGGKTFANVPSPSIANACGGIYVSLSIRALGERSIFGDPTHFLLVKVVQWDLDPLFCCVLFVDFRSSRDF